MSLETTSNGKEQRPLYCWRRLATTTVETYRVASPKGARGAPRHATTLSEDQRALASPPLPRFRLEPPLCHSMWALRNGKDASGSASNLHYRTAVHGAVELLRNAPHWRAKLPETSGVDRSAGVTDVHLIVGDTNELPTTPTVHSDRSPMCT